MRPSAPEWRDPGFWWAAVSVTRTKSNSKGRPSAWRDWGPARFCLRIDAAPHPPHNSRMPDAGAEYVALPIYHEELAKALNFTPSDLQENRAGRLSASQCSTQLQAVGRATAKSVVLVVLAVVCVAGAFAIGVTTVLALILLVLAAAFIAFVGIFAWFMPPI